MRIFILTIFLFTCISCTSSYLTKRPEKSSKIFTQDVRCISFKENPPFKMPIPKF